MNEENKDIIGEEETKGNNQPENSGETFEDMLSRAEEKRKLRKQSKKKKTVKKVVLSLLCIVLACVLALGSLVIIEINGGVRKTVTVDVEKGSSAYQIADALKESGAIKSAVLFKVYCKIKGYGQNFKFGSYEIKEKSSYADIVNALSEQGRASIVRVTVPEGTGIYDYVKKVNDNYVTIPGLGSLLEKEGVCKKEDFYEALNNARLDGIAKNANTEKAYVALEGYLFPDTYQFYAYDSKECAALAVEKMLDTMDEKFTDEMVKRAEEINMTVNEVLTLASIIQLEAGNAGEDMPKVAAVFYNRMNRGERLGSSPTGFYGKAFKQDDGRYNTNDVSGLPPGPICTVSIKSINAVLYPEENFKQYFYFVTDSSGKFYYHKTYNEQVNTINRLKRENKWIYESFD